MKDLLTNEEIDSLLELFRAESGGAAEEPSQPVERDRADRPEPAAVRPLDLLKPNRFGRERLHFLERLMASVAKGAAGVLSDRLRLDAICDCVSVEQARFSSWRRQLDSPVGVWTIAAPPFASPLLLTLTGDLLRGAVDRLLGGPGRVGRSQEGFTQAEFAVADAVVEPLLEGIAASFADVIAIRPRIDGRSGNPAMVQAMAPTDVALTAYFQVGGDVLHGDMRLAMAYQDLEPYLERATRGRGQTEVEGADREAVTRVAREIPLRVATVLGRTKIRVRSLLELRPGDIVRLERTRDEALEAEVEGVTKLRGWLGRKGSARVFRVEEVLSNVDDERR